jgi:hypothetical protein
MSIIATIHHGQLKMPDNVPVDDGVTVDVAYPSAVKTSDKNGKSDEQSPPGRVPASLIGCITDWPEDMAERHDFYLHGRRDP